MTKDEALENRMNERRLERKSQVRMRKRVRGGRNVEGPDKQERPMMGGSHEKRLRGNLTRLHSAANPADGRHLIRD